MIATHKDLAHAIKGKRILHLNSLGKDAVLCLDWLARYADCEVVSVFFKFDARYPSEDAYFEYLKTQYPKVLFTTEQSLVEMNEKMAGMLQSPLVINYVNNNQDFEEFDTKKFIDEVRIKYGCDYSCSGISCYEGMGRALYLRRVGLLDERNKFIYPIGLMKQAQVTDLLKKIPTKLNPSYKFSPESHDSASYFRMRYAFIARPKFKEIMYAHYPMLALDEYRFEKLFRERG